MKILLVLFLMCSLLLCGAAKDTKSSDAKKAKGKAKTAKTVTAKKKAAAPKAAAAGKKGSAKAAPKAAAPKAPAAPAAAPAVPKAPAAGAAVKSEPVRNVAVDFRGGKILCAEISSLFPSGVKGFDEKNFAFLPARRMYAAVTMLCDPDRFLSIHDYCLDVYGHQPCVAIKEGSGAFISSPEKVFRVNPKTRYTLLFVLDAAVAGSQDEYCNIKALCDDGAFSKTLVLFKNIGNKPFTAPGRIPLSGLIPEKK
ncbi:MAG: hypothetical protein IKB99_02790 [Lentisphaeria bacterium]|nr:hypothetical protein [Lentisphaeria bacterium]